MPTNQITAAIARCEEDDLITVLRALEERLNALGHEAVAGYLADAASDLRYLVDRQTELDRESAEFNLEWSSATVLRKTGLEWGLVPTGEVAR